MLEQSDAPKQARKRFISCEICKYRSFRVMGKKRDFMSQFPLNEARCKEWVRRVGNEDLAYVPIEKLHMLKYICGQHFTPRDFNRKKSRLRRTAIPSLNLKHPPLSDEIMANFPLHIYRRSDSEAEDSKDNEEIGTPSQPGPPSPSFVVMQPRKVDPSLIIPYIVSDTEYLSEPQILSTLPTSLPYENLIDEPPEENNEAPLVVRLSCKRKPIAEAEKSPETTVVVTLDPLTNNPTLLIKPKTDATEKPKEPVFDQRNVIDVTQLPTFRTSDLLSDCTFIKVTKPTDDDDKDEEPKKGVKNKKRVKEAPRNPQSKENDVTPHPEVIIDEKGRVLLKHFPTPAKNDNLIDSTNVFETSNVENSDDNINQNQDQENKTKKGQENIDEEEQVLPEDLPDCIIPDVLFQESRNKRGMTLEIEDYIVPVTRGEKFLYTYLLQVKTQLAKFKYLLTKQLYSLKVAKNIVSNPELLATVEHLPSTQKLLTLLPPIDQRPHYKMNIKHKIEAVYILTKAPYGYEFLSEMLTLPRSAVLVKLIRQANKIMSIVNSMYESNDTQTVPL